MTKSMEKTLAAPTLPHAPWIYIHDPSPDGRYAAALASLIPVTSHIQLAKSASGVNLSANHKALSYYEGVVIISADAEEKHREPEAQNCKSTAIKKGRNFASVNLYDDQGSGGEEVNWGANHLNLHITKDSSGDASAIGVATKIYRWLFSVFTVLETLFLIPDEQMKLTDSSTAFKDYKYCPIGESRKFPRDAEVQFVALILTKPAVGPDKRISWQVADKTGSANFYFQYRGPSSQYTWDWVLSLKPGDRKCLPRMPMVQIKERKFVTVVKAPLRITGGLIGGAGFVIKTAGRGVCKAGRMLKLGARSEWVPEADIVYDAKGKPSKKPAENDDHITVIPAVKKTEIQIFTDKGEKTWKDSDSLASTTAGDEHDEKKILDVV